MTEEEKQGEENKEEKKKSKTEEAREAAKELREATEDQKKENDRTEQLQINNQLGGTTEAGQETPKPKEETDKEYAEKILAGEK